MTALGWTVFVLLAWIVYAGRRLKKDRPGKSRRFEEGWLE